MADPEVVHTVQQWANDLLVWVGFGTIVGLLAKAIMPGRDPGGAVVTMMVGIGGAVVGSGTLMYFWEGRRVTPLTPTGFVVATAGAFVLLFFYRLLGGRWFVEGEIPRPFYSRPRTRRRREPTYYEDEANGPRYL